MLSFLPFNSLICKKSNNLRKNLIISLILSFRFFQGFNFPSDVPEQAKDKISSCIISFTTIDAYPGWYSLHRRNSCKEEKKLL